MCILLCTLSAYKKGNKNTELWWIKINTTNYYKNKYIDSWHKDFFATCDITRVVIEMNEQSLYILIKGLPRSPHVRWIKG